MNPGQQTGTATLTTATGREIRVERVFNASRDRVWQAFTDREQIA